MAEERSRRAVRVLGAGHQRQELARILPLETPLSVHIFPTTSCNMRCGYCPQSLPKAELRQLGFGKQSMSMTTLERSIEDMKAFPERLKVLVFAGWGEPMVHDEIGEMLRMSKAADVAERVELVTNGTLLSGERLEGIIASGVDRVRLSIQGVTRDRYRQIAGVPFDVERIAEGVAALSARAENTMVYVKTVDSSLADDDERARFYEMFETICDEISVEHVIPVNRELDVEIFGERFESRHCGGDARDVMVCPFPFYMMVIRPDGEVTPCCCFGAPLKVGQVGKESLTTIWRGRRLEAFRMMHLRAQRGRHSKCRTCLSPKYDIQEGDCLDDSRKDLLALYEEGNDGEEDERQDRTRV